ncbi:MAG: DUF547 domain-containing protein [Bacteroidota bacterium]
MPLRFLLSSCLLLVLFSCGQADPPVEAAESPALPVEQDVVAHTRNNSPEIVAEEKLPLPEVAKEPVPAPPVPKVRPAKPAPDATVTEDKPVIESRPMPQPEMETLAPDPEPRTDPAPAAAPPTPSVAITRSVNHSPWNDLLQKHVNHQGNVNYAAFKKEEAKLDAYLATLAKEIPTKDWPSKAALAYWINAYNAFTIKRILNDYPLKSIMDLDGGKPWDVKWIELAGKTYSLNQIEHEIIRPRFQEPRIHFAVNCAAASCPPLPNEAFTADNLNALLQKNTRSFIRNARYNQTEGAIKISKIFDWYGEDFGNLRNYLNKYLAEPLPVGEKIGFKEYDWALNEQ